MDVILVCHTEPGFVANKIIIGDKKAKKGVSEGAKKLAALADKYGAKVTFCVCPEVADSFPKDINHEIGLHIHPGWEELKYGKFSWFVGDEYLKTHAKQSLTSTALRDYSYEDQLDMITKGKSFLEAKFRTPVRVFTAGRWSVSNDTVKALVNQGFTHDCSAPAHSISDHYDWIKLKRIQMPFHPSENDYQVEGKLPITMIPVSQTLLGGTASIEGETVYGLPWLKACFKEYYFLGVPLFHLSIHSPAMTDQHYISIMEDFLSFIASHKNINFKFASGIGIYPDKKYSANIWPYLSGINKNLIKTAFKRIFGVKTIYG